MGMDIVYTPFAALIFFDNYILQTFILSLLLESKKNFRTFAASIRVL
jgi:hypothetical protein